MYMRFDVQLVRSSHTFLFLNFVLFLYVAMVQLFADLSSVLSDRTHRTMRMCGGIDK